MKLFIDVNLPDLNTYIDKERANKFKAAKIKKDATNSVAYQVSHQVKNCKFDGLCDISFTWFVPDNKKDHDNICFAKKFILDGLVKAKILMNDSPRYVRNFQDNFILDRIKRKQSVEVLITKVYELAE